MLRLAVRSLTMAGAMAAVVFMAPAWSAAGLFDCFGHCGTPAPVAMAPACGACAAPTVAYMPTSVYRTLYAPACANCPAAAPCGACGTCGTCNTCNSYAVTTYRPWYGGWTTYSARLMPYTTYQPVTYAPPCGVCGSCARLAARAARAVAVAFAPCFDPCSVAVHARLAMRARRIARVRFAVRAPVATPASVTVLVPVVVRARVAARASVAVRVRVALRVLVAARVAAVAARSAMPRRPRLVRRAPRPWSPRLRCPRQWLHRRRWLLRYPCLWRLRT